MHLNHGQHGNAQDVPNVPRPYPPPLLHQASASARARALPVLQRGALAGLLTLAQHCQLIFRRVFQERMSVELDENLLLIFHVPVQQSTKEQL